MGANLRIGIFLLMCVCSDALAGFAEGMSAYARGDCSLAYQEFAAAARHGDSDALMNMATLRDFCCSQPADAEDEDELMVCKAAAANNSAARLLVLYGRILAGSACGQPETNSKDDIKKLNQLALALAEQGFPFAMSVAAGFYEKTDLVRAYAWYSLAARRGLDDSERRDKVTAKLSTEELARGKDLVEELDKRTPQTRIIGPNPSCRPGG